MLTGTIASELIKNARIWTLTLPRDPRPGELIEWSEPELGSCPARTGVRGWISSEPSNRPGTQILTVSGEGARWVIVNVPRPRITYVATHMPDHRYSPSAQVLIDGRYAGNVYPYAMGDTDRYGSALCGVTFVAGDSSPISVDILRKNVHRLYQTIALSFSPF